MTIIISIIHDSNLCKQNTIILSNDGIRFGITRKGCQYPQHLQQDYHLQKSKGYIVNGYIHMHTYLHAGLYKSDALKCAIILYLLLTISILFVSTYCFASVFKLLQGSQVRTNTPWTRFSPFVHELFCLFCIHFHVWSVFCSVYVLSMELYVPVISSNFHC